jgi:hypothetical protein
MLLIAAITIDSTSNSLGRKSVDLIFMVACMVAMTGFPRNVPNRMAAILRRSQAQLPAGLRRPADRLSTRPIYGKFAGLKP